MLTDDFNPAGALRLWSTDSEFPQAYHMPEVQARLRQVAAEFERLRAALRLIAETPGDAYDLRQIARSALPTKGTSEFPPGTEPVTARLCGDPSGIEIGPIDVSVERACTCYTCATDYHRMTRMIVCEICGNKRCPHGTDHRLECTNSNEPGQPGSRYE